MCERSGDNNVPSRNLYYISKVMISKCMLVIMLAYRDGKQINEVFYF